MLVYVYIFTCLYCFGVDSRTVFSVRVKFVVGHVHAAAAHREANGKFKGEL